MSERLSLFSNYHRTASGPKRYAETDYGFLDRSARDAFIRVRKELDGYFSKYPIAHQNELHARIKCDDDTNFRSAVFELIAHEMLLRLGYELTVHPEVSRSRRRPDFLAIHDGERLYVELALITGTSKDEVAAESRKNVVYDAINGLDSPDFYLSMHIEGSPSTPPPARKLRGTLEMWLRSLSWEERGRANSYGSKDGRPTFRWEHDGWQVTFTAVAKGAAMRGKPEIRPAASMIETFSGGAEWQTVKVAVADKGGAYGRLDAAYLTAFNVLDDTIEDLDIEQGLFGEEQIYVPLGGGKEHIGRAANGAWRGGDRPQFTRMSGALFFHRLSPSSLGHARAVLFEHPCAAFRLRGPILTMQRRVVAKKKLVTRPGKSVAKILGLSCNWPEIA